MRRRHGLRFVIIRLPVDHRESRRNTGAYADRVRRPLPQLIILGERMCLMDRTETVGRLLEMPELRYVSVCLFSTSARRAQVELADERLTAPGRQPNIVRVSVSDSVITIMIASQTKPLPASSQTTLSL